MSEPFEFVDPLEGFVEAREVVSAGIETARQGSQTRTHQTLWLVGAAVLAISTLIFVDALSPRIGREFASKVNNRSASDTAPQHQLLSPGSDPPAFPAAPPRAQSAHAIDPEQRQVQTSQPLSPATSGQQAATMESSTSAQLSAQLKYQSPAAAEVTEAPSPGLGDQLLKITSAVSIRNGPSASADIIGMAYAGTVARVASRDSGWTQIVDPSSGRTGWIDSTVLSPLTHTVDTASTEDSTPKQMSEGELFEIPDENALPAVKPKKHASNRKHASSRKNASNRRYGRRGVVPLRFAFRLFRR